ncbi:MAG: nucleotide sugar dehydrogenase, partial [bacterium]
MNLSVFGLGYVGCVSAACFAKLGHTVIGVDVNPEKVKLINAGKSTVLEERIAEMVQEVVASGSLRATTSAQEAVQQSEISLICVGTPSCENGSLNLDYIRSCAQSVAEAIAGKAEYHVVVIRSTMLPGSIRSTVVPILEEYSGKKASQDFGVCMNPEFLREGSSVRDFHNPPYSVIGADDDRAAEKLEDLYVPIGAPIVRISVETAEMIKYASNSFHAVKICFANEMGRLCKAAGVDSHQLMELFCLDDKLNISRAYLKPGFAFGGSCLPKDIRA